MGRPVYFLEVSVNHFERVAIFTVVESIENQLKGLKTLIAASANSSSPEQNQQHRVTSTIPADSQELPDEDEDRLAKILEEDRAELVKKAEAAFQKEFKSITSAMDKLDN